MKRQMLKNSKKLMLVLAAITLVMTLICSAVLNLNNEEEMPKMSIKVLEISANSEENYERINSGEEAEEVEVESTQIAGKEKQKAYAVAEIAGKKYINKTNTVVLQLDGTDENYKSNSLTKDSIIVYVGTEVVSPAIKNLSAATTIANGVRYTLTLGGIPGNGKLSVEVAANTLEDKSLNNNR